jgi:hypothetical protein
MISLAARFAGSAEASVAAGELQGHPDFDHYTAAIADGSIESLQKFLVDRPASPFAGSIFAQIAQQIECDPNDPNMLLINPDCQAPVATIY